MKDLSSQQKIDGRRLLNGRKREKKAVSKMGYETIVITIFVTLWIVGVLSE